jgi:hypothetical protein
LLDAAESSNLDAPESTLTKPNDNRSEVLA